MLPGDERGAMRRELVEKARAGDRDSFATLVADSISRLFKIAQLMLGDRDLADDAVQETLVLAWRDLRGLRDLDGFDAWLHRVLVRSVHREARRERRRSVLTTHVEEAATDPGAAVAFEDHNPSTDGWGDVFVMDRDGSDVHVLARTALHENHGHWGV
jgi:DNA-directed RNA polymerase specialized sigma24 family protein